jgi:hypothetical protein
MAIKQLQSRLTQVGVIRLGEKRKAASGKEYPAKLETFRVTSPSKPLIESVAALLGGEVRPWQSKTGPEWEVVTNATEIPVHVPPQVIDPNYELWGNGFRARLCDGETERIRDAACLCEAAARVRYERAKLSWPEDGLFDRTKDDCKPTTRITLMISDIPAGAGTFKLESHGMNAAAELPALSAAIAAANQPIPATLRLQQREGGVMKIVDGREKVEARKYAVPVLDFFGLFTPRQAFSGQLESAIQQAIGGAQQAIEAPKPTEGDVLDQAEKLDAVEDLQQLWRQAGTDGVLTDAVKKVLQGRVAEIQAAAAKASDGQAVKTAPPVVEPAPVPPTAQVVDADVEPDADETWAAIVREAGKAGWNLPTLEDKFSTALGKDAGDANGWELEHFLGELKTGRVA